MIDLSRFVLAVRTPGRVRTTTLLCTVVWFILFGGLWFVQPILPIVWLVATLAVALCVHAPLLPIYGIALTYPFISWEIVAGSLNIPIVDVIGTIGCCAWICRLLWEIVVHRRRPHHLLLWGLPLFLAWVVIACISALGAFEPWLSLKFVLRPLAFFYPVFVLLPLNHIRHSDHLYRILQLMFMVGIIVALYGAYGYLTSDAINFLSRRAVPVPIFGFNPLGGNWNLIADVMVTTIPIGFFLLNYLKDASQKKLIFLGLAVLIGVDLLTFSRSGWLALMVEGVIMVLLLYRDRLRSLLVSSIPIAFLLSPVVIFMLLFSSQDQAESSNYNRSILTDIAIAQWREHPWFGAGPGTFYDSVGRNYVYLVEFGSPLDAHGFIQKIMAELGSFGLITFMALLSYILLKIFFAIRHFRQHPVAGPLLICMFMMVAGSIFFQLFQTSYFVAKLWFPMGVALAAVHVARKELSHITV
jgi:hypothetical protein